MRKDIYISKVLLAIYLKNIRDVLLLLQQAQNSEQWSNERVALMQIEARLVRESSESLGDGLYAQYRNRFEEHITHALGVIKKRLTKEFALDTVIHEGIDLPGEVREHEDDSAEVFSL